MLNFLEVVNRDHSSTLLSFEKMEFFCILASRSKMAVLRHLGFYGSNNGFFEKPMCDNSDHIALNCLAFEKIAFLHVGVKIQDGGYPPSWILGVP